VTDAPHILDGEVTLVVGFPPGGASDKLARSLAGPLADALSQRVEVRNEPGEAGAAAARLVARAHRNGSTLLVGNNGLLAAAPVLVADAGYHPERDFAPVVLIGLQPSVLVAGPAQGAGSLGELLEKVKAGRGRLRCAVSGQGAASHLAARMLAWRLDLPVRECAYDGAAAALLDVAGGAVDLMFATISSVLPHIAKGRVRPLAVTTATRSRRLPRVPTMVEFGFRGFEIASWHGLVAPAGTPDGIVEEVHHATARALRTPAAVSSLHELGIEPLGSAPAAFAAFIAAERPKWAALAAPTGDAGGGSTG
jgi:tripartite-type tricarboxylate transporter receptor subunit TctC